MRFRKYLLIILVISSFSSLILTIKAMHRVRCHDHEKEALLRFKQSLLVDCVGSSTPKMKSWQEHEVVANGSNKNVADCCTWDGVECDNQTDSVIGLDLSRSCIYGKLHINSTLFSLNHLISLDLSFNDFNNSRIPSSIGRLSRLRYLELSNSRFSGQVPSEISLLSSLTVLDLSYNGNPTATFYDPYNLAFGDLSLDKLVSNLTRLAQLYLDSVSISSVVPPILSNTTSLTILSLSSCQLYGELPQGIFQLPHLVGLILRNNERLEGHLPEFPSNSPLESLDLLVTGFSGELPSSIGNLNGLKTLSLYDSSFSGHIPASLGNLTQLNTLGLPDGCSGTMPSSLTNLTNLESLTLSGLQVSPMILDLWLLKLDDLYTLTLNFMSLGEKTPSNLANLTNLQELDLRFNKLFGTLPQWFANLTQLTELLLGDNQLGGPVQPWLSKLVNLQALDLSNTNFVVVGMTEQFFELPNIQDLYLDNLDVTFLPNSVANESSLPKLGILSLSFCNLTEFPQILRHQNELNYLYLDGNHIRGHVPQWFIDTTKESLLLLNLSSNSLVGFEQPLVFLPWTNLEGLDLRGNKLRGLLPIPLNSLQVYDISSNHIYGAIPKQICLAISLKILDLSTNNMDGPIPQCISHQLGNSLQVLNLRSNNFYGTIPQRFHKTCSLKMINLSDNRLDGQLPRSLANCTMLEVLDLGNNLVNDTFPSWLGTLSDLQVLVLRHNNFHDNIIEDPNSSHGFGRLRIIDLSHNFHVGTLPSRYIQGWRAMQVTSEFQPSSSNSVITISYRQSGGRGLLFAFYTFNYVITITNKGAETLYPRILTVLRVVDFSSNNFTGIIPSFLGDLRGIQALNLSNNNLEGNIPSSLSKISDLQSLDISQNKLSGVIPQELTKLTFLEVFNVSYNRLVGSIPQGEQFDTFDNSSYDGNLALCGVPLSKMCGILPPSPGPPSQQEANGDDEEDPDSISWIVIALGCASGFIVGFVTGKLYITDRHHGWFMKTFAKKRKSKKRGRNASNRTRNQ